MKNPSSNIKETFSGRSTSNAVRPTPEGRSRSFRYFGIAEDTAFVLRIKLLFRDGRRVSIPYAYLPIIELRPDGELSIRTEDLSITVYGRGLVELEQWLSVERVLWIKESESGRDDEQTMMFISSIEIDGI